MTVHHHRRRRRYQRLLGAATVTTVTITGIGVLLGPAGPGPTLASSEGQGASTPVSAALEAAADVAAEVATMEPAVPLPEVAEQRHADFWAGDGLPDGSRVFNTGSNKSGMALAGGRLVHGDPVGSGAASFVETRIKGEVRSLGARVRFADGTSGSVALVGWQTSLVEADRTGAATPSTGLRLVVSPGHWELSVVDGDVHVISTGSYEVAPGPTTFEVRRDGSTLYVVDPGGVTQVEDKRAARLAGPWASWGLTETGPDQSPASIEAVWAG